MDLNKGQIALVEETLNCFCELMHDTAKDKGWWEDKSHLLSYIKDDTPDDLKREIIDKLIGFNVAEKLMLIVSEVSEGMEADRKNLKDDKLQEYDGLIVELADTVIRCADLASALGYKNFGNIIMEKWRFNCNREYKHGNKRY